MARGSKGFLNEPPEVSVEAEIDARRVLRVPKPGRVAVREDGVDAVEMVRDLREREGAAADGVAGTEGADGPVPKSSVNELNISFCVTGANEERALAVVIIDLDRLGCIS